MIKSVDNIKKGRIIDNIQNKKHFVYKTKQQTEINMKSIYDLTNEQINALVDRHNSMVKPEFATSPDFFARWVEDEGNFEEDYIEISSNETLSGHAEILDLEPEVA